MRNVLELPTYLAAKENLSKIVKRIQISSNSQSGCERGNSKINRSKEKYSSCMGVTVDENAPPLHIFNSKCVDKAVEYWKANNHRITLKVNDQSNSKVIKRVQ